MTSLALSPTCRRPQPPPLALALPAAALTGPASHWQTNRLLAALQASQGATGLDQLHSIELPQGLVLHEPGQALGHAYFPTTAIVSLSCVLEDGGSADIAVVGNEGLVGMALFMGGETTPSRAVVQSAGWGYRVPAAVLKHVFEHTPAASRLLLRYTLALITQMAQTAVCNRHHSVDQQLSRWLLMSLDRHQGSELLITQEKIASMLGVRREGVTEAALKLKAAGLIDYARGRIQVLDRAALQERSCECYQAVRQEYDRLLT